MTVPVERGPLAWRRVTIDGTTPVEHVEFLLAAMRTDLGAGPVELWVEPQRPSPLLVVTMRQARHVDVTVPPAKPGKRAGQ